MTFELIYPQELQNIQRRENAEIIDIRSAKDYRKGHVAGAVHLSPDEMDDFEGRFQKNRFYILYCEYGGSSMQYARDLGRKGYRVGTVVGGWNAIRKYQDRRTS